MERKIHVHTPSPSLSASVANFDKLKAQRLRSNLMRFPEAKVLQVFNEIMLEFWGRWMTKGIFWGLGECDAPKICLSHLSYLSKWLVSIILLISLGTQTHSYNQKSNTYTHSCSHHQKAKQFISKKVRPNKKKLFAKKASHGQNRCYRKKRLNMSQSLWYVFFGVLSLPSITFGCHRVTIH